MTASEAQRRAVARCKRTTTLRADPTSTLHLALESLSSVLGRMLGANDPADAYRQGVEGVLPFVHTIHVASERNFKPGKVNRRTGELQAGLDGVVSLTPLGALYSAEWTVEEQWSRQAPASGERGIRVYASRGEQDWASMFLGESLLAQGHQPAKFTEQPDAVLDESINAPIHLPPFLSTVGPHQQPPSTRKEREELCRSLKAVLVRDDTTERMVLPSLDPPPAPPPAELAAVARPPQVVHAMRDLDSLLGPASLSTIVLSLVPHGQTATLTYVDRAEVEAVMVEEATTRFRRFFERAQRRAAEGREATAGESAAAHESAPLVDKLVVAFDQSSVTPNLLLTAVAIGAALTGDHKPLERVDLGSATWTNLAILAGGNLSLLLDLVNSRIDKPLDEHAYYRALTLAVVHPGLPSSPADVASEERDPTTGLSSLKAGVYCPQSPSNNHLRRLILAGLHRDPVRDDNEQGWWSLLIELGAVPATGTRPPPLAPSSPHVERAQRLVRRSSRSRSPSPRALETRSRALSPPRAASEGRLAQDARRLGTSQPGTPFGMPFDMSLWDERDYGSTRAQPGEFGERDEAFRRSYSRYDSDEDDEDDEELDNLDDDKQVSWEGKSADVVARQVARREREQREQEAAARRALDLILPVVDRKGRLSHYAVSHDDGAGSGSMRYLEIRTAQDEVALLWPRLVSGPLELFVEDLDERKLLSAVFTEQGLALDALRIELRHFVEDARLRCRVARTLRQLPRFVEYPILDILDERLIQVEQAISSVPWAQQVEVVRRMLLAAPGRGPDSVSSHTSDPIPHYESMLRLLDFLAIVADDDWPDALPLDLESVGQGHHHARSQTEQLIASTSLSFRPGDSPATFSAALLALDRRLRAHGRGDETHPTGTIKLAAHHLGLVDYNLLPSAAYATDREAPAAEEVATVLAWFGNLEDKQRITGVALLLQLRSLRLPSIVAESVLDTLERVEAVLQAALSGPDGIALSHEALQQRLGGRLAKREQVRKDRKRGLFWKKFAS